MSKKVIFNGQEWDYREDMSWNLYEEGLSNAGIIHFDNKRKGARQLRERVSFKKEELKFI